MRRRGLHTARQPRCVATAGGTTIDSERRQLRTSPALAAPAGSSASSGSAALPAAYEHTLESTQPRLPTGSISRRSAAQCGALAHGPAAAAAAHYYSNTRIPVGSSAGTVVCTHVRSIIKTTKAPGVHVLYSCINDAASEPMPGMQYSRYIGSYPATRAKLVRTFCVFRDGDESWSNRNAGW